MPSLYQSADVFLQCSKDEPFPLVFLEAMACGIPVVAHDIPRVRWFIGDNEFLVNMDDPEEIAETIKRAYACASGGREQRVKRAEALSWTKVAGMYREFFQDVIDRSR